jgi:vitamin B12 transporter
MSLRSSFAVALLAFGLPLGAQPARNPAADTTALGPVVVTATRLPVAAATATTTVISGADLRARGVARVADALREVPGAAVVQSGSYGGTTSLFLRGGESKYAKVLIDGVPANLPGGAYDLAFLTTDNIDRIEIVRGPASVLYGSDAVTGVIQIFTRDGNGPVRPQASLRGGSYGTLEGDIGVVGSVGKGSFSLDAAHHTTDGILPRDHVFRNSVLSGQYHLRPDARSDVRVTSRYSDGTFNYPTDGNGVVQPFQAARRNDRRLTVGVDAGRFLLPNVETRLALSDNEITGRSTDDPTAPGDTMRFYSRSTQHDRRRTADLRTNVYAGSGNVLTGGIELSRQTEDSRGTSRFQKFAPSSTSFDQSRRNLAYYAQWVGTAARALSYSASGRIDDNQRFGTFATYRAGLGYALPTGTRLRAAAGTSFKEPLFGEQFATSFTVGNPDLDPERAATWEAGLEQALVGGRVTLGATYFDQRFHNMIQYRSTPSGAPRTTPNYFNVAGANARGLELEGRVASAAGVSLRGSYTYLRTRVTNAGNGASGTFVLGDRLIRRPTHAGSVTASAPVARRGTVALTANYFGERGDRDFRSFPAKAVSLGGYATVDGSADVRVLDRATAPLALTLRVENALDREYQAVQGYASPGRAILAGVRIGAR